MMPLPKWVVDAARLPVAFAQVREDPLLDLAVLKGIITHHQSPPGRGGLSALMIASGGCTAAFLCASGLLAHLHLVDFNPGQMELCRLKLFLLQNADPTRRLELMGHHSADKTGSDYHGRYEVLFAHLRDAMRNSLGELEAVLRLDNPAERSARVESHTPLGIVLDHAFDDVMALPNLVALFGEQATQNSREPFSRHFARRTRHAIESLPTENNPYLWQLLLGRFPDGVSYPWFTAAAPKQMPEIAETIGTIDTALAIHHDRFDFVHLSNVLDWLSVDEARTTMRLAYDALRPGGCVIIRQLNSTLDLPALGDSFEWLTAEADRLHTIDRSFFYRSLHVGRKR
jgi:S-adenosylmethionine-diacylglycerol 3-amino-3-carboxypropyl transferase